MFLFLLSITLFLGSKYFKEKIEINKRLVFSEKITTMTNQVDSTYQTSQELLDIYRRELNNNDIVGMIKIKGLSINSLILQGHDNIFYLSHLEDKTSNWIGSIMLDYRTSLDNGKVSIIYGHNSVNAKLVFGKLEGYDSQSFYKDNSVIEILTNNGLIEYEIFSVTRLSKNSDKHLRVTFTGNEYREHLNYLKQASIYETNVSVNEDDEILVIQTCSLKERDKFYIISARKVKV